MQEATPTPRAAGQSREAVSAELRGYSRGSGSKEEKSIRQELESRKRCKLSEKPLKAERGEEIF